LTLGGADWEECYELVLYEAREKLSWTPGTQRSLVMIGDAKPHPPTFHMNTLKLDWRVEAKKLHDELGVKIYAVQVCVCVCVCTCVEEGEVTTTNNTAQESGVGSTSHVGKKATQRYHATTRSQSCVSTNMSNRVKSG